MEARLFIVSIWCGLYGQLIRLISRKEGMMAKPGVVMLINSLFWGTFMSMAGMLVASYSERLDQTNRYSIIFGLVGLGVGAAIGFWRSRDVEESDALVKDNLEWADTGFSAILLASFVMFFVVQAFKIPSGSMRMTFVEGDHLFVNKFIYGVPVPFSDKKLLSFRKIKVNDIVIFRFPAASKDDPHYGKDFIKRAVALEGQRVEIKNKHLFVDGVEREEPFVQFVDPNMYSALEGYSPESFEKGWASREFADMGNDVRDNFGPIVVPPGHIFVMGDNRDRSFDSRFWGPLKMSAVKGRAWLLYWPLKRFRLSR